MQKVQFYLVPNRITVTTDLVGFNTEYRQVYQRKIKLHKGIDNTLEFEVKNSDQRRETVIGWQVVVKFFDSERKELLQITGDAIEAKPGLMSVVVTAEDIANIEPQMLTAAAYLTNGVDADRILYSDSQFDVLATVEILDGYNAAPRWSEQLNVFNYEHDANSYFSEIGNFGPTTNQDIGLTRTITVEVYPNIGFNGDVIVYATNDKSTSFGTNWKRLGTMSINALIHSPTSDTYSFSGEYKFIRFAFNKHNPPSPASTPNPTLTGTLDKIIVRD